MRLPGTGAGGISCGPPLTGDGWACTSTHRLRGYVGMRTATSDRAPNLTLSEITGLALCHGAPVEDVPLIAVNLLGIAFEDQRHRDRMISLVSQPDVRWLVLPNFGASPCRLRGEELSLGTDVVGWLRWIDADEAGGGCLRDGARAATVNPNACSRCTGLGVIGCLSSVCECDETSNRSPIRAGYVRRRGSVTDCLEIELTDNPQTHHCVVRYYTCSVSSTNKRVIRPPTASHIFGPS